MKKISILLSCFNASNLIENYINSIIKADINEIATLIAIDFPFSHRDREFVEKQLRRYPDLVYCQKDENISLYDAWNEAIELATTEYVGNLNLDDRVSSNYYKTAVSALDEFSADVFSSFSIITSKIGSPSPDARVHEHIPSDRFCESTIIEYSLKDLVTFVAGRLVKQNIPHCAPVWRRSLHDQLGDFDAKSFDFCADYEFWLRVAAAKKKMIVSCEPMTTFYCAKGTASDRLMSPESKEILDRWKRFFPPKNYRQTRLGEEHDLLHYCLNMNVIFSSRKYYEHLINDEQLSFELTHFEQCANQVLIRSSEATNMPLATAPNDSDVVADKLHRKPSRLMQFKDCHEGERALLLCNGPSLNKVDFTCVDLAGFTIVGLNKIFLGFERLGVEPKYIVAVNKKVIEQAADVYNKLQIIKFISNRVGDKLVPESDTTFHINTANLPYPHKRFSEDITAYVHEGWTVTHVALQILCYMGFAEVYIVGMDHRFSQHQTGKENLESVIKGADVDHFDPRYFGNGQSWDFPDLSNSEVSYRAALEAFNRNGRAIFDCTIDGACTVFPRLPIEIIYASSNLLISNVKLARNVDHEGSNPLVSVICPVFNAVRFLYQSVSSILRQNIVDFELILVDDGSEDGSLQLAKRLAEQDVRIKSVRNYRRKGVSGARNTGLDIARGEFIAFLDADDEYDDGALQARLKTFELYPGLELVHSSLRFVDSHGNYLGFTISTKKTISFSDVTINPASFNTIMGRCNVLKKFRFAEDLTNGEDWLFLATILRSGVRSHFVEGGGAAYRVHQDSTVLSNLKNHEHTLQRVIDWIYSDSEDTEVADEFRKGLVSPPKSEIILRRRLSLFLSFLLAGDIKECSSMLSDPKLLSFMKEQKSDFFRSALRVPVIRQFSVKFEEAKDLPEIVRSRIAITDVSLRLDSLIPQLHDVLSHFFELQCKFSRNDIYGPFSRTMQAHLDETSIIAEILRSSKGSTHTMIDVGAHFGSSLAPFLNKGWKIFAFEPDKKNRQKLLDRLAKHKNSSLVKVDTSAVSNENRKGVAFFSSEESTGVSGLSAFLPSHESKQFVDTITLSEVLAGESLTTIDFLKIDTEGHDLFVLKGYPWERGKPAVIECEFEDSKTVPSGYTFHDLARYLVEKGYRVYVSEWHPIIRYGIQHDWRQLMRYPCELADPKGWGNLLAFRDPIDEQMLVTAVKKELKVASGKSEPKSEKQFYGPNLRILGMLYEFQIETGAQCTPIASNQWRYTHHDNKHNLWEASFDIATETANRIIAGCLWMQSDRQITLQASLGSNDQTDYEGTTQNITLTPGVEQCVKLSKCFDNTHKALKIKIDILDSSDGGSSVLTINGCVGVIESFAGIYERLGVDNLNITVANRLFREGDYSTALGIYISLSHQRPLTMYADNAFRSARRLGMSWVKTKEDLAMLSG